MIGHSEPASSAHHADQELGSQRSRIDILFKCGQNGGSVCVLPVLPRYSA
jgi:hypothetical protein